MNGPGSAFSGACGHVRPLNPEYLAVLLFLNTLNAFALATVMPYPIWSPSMVLSLTVPPWTMDSVSSVQQAIPTLIPPLIYDPNAEMVL